MGIEDRDYHREWWNNKTGYVEKSIFRRSASARQNKINFSVTHAVEAKKSTHPVLIIMVWATVFFTVFGVFKHIMKSKPVIITAVGDLVIPRASDGHYYVDGTVNGKPLHFLVDTGATTVTVTEKFASQAALQFSQSTISNTANGQLKGWSAKDVSVTTGPLGVSSVSVGVGLVGFDADQGLLGQNFLSKFDIEIKNNKMIFREKAK